MEKSILQNSSVYAVSQIGNSKILSKKLLWLLVLILTLLGCSYKIYSFITVYIDYPVVVELRIEKQTNAYFPAVTVCNLNRMRSQFKHCLDNISSCPRLVFTNPLTLPERRNFHSCSNRFSGKKNKNIDDNLQFLEKYSKLDERDRMRFGHTQPQVIKSCSFRDKPCIFKQFLNIRYGNCFIFNRESATPLMVKSSGFDNSLEMVLDAQLDQYFPITQTIGLRVVIHHPLDNPNPEENGINILPGYENDIFLRQTTFFRLSAPYKDRCINYPVKNESFMKSQTMCMQACIQEYNYAKCGCIETFFEGMPSYALCNITNSTEMCCLDRVINDLAVQGTTCKCPLQCMSTNYNDHAIKAKWPSKQFFFNKISNRSFSGSYENFRMNHAKVRVFFSTLDKTVYDQKPKFLETQIFSSLGGEFGLWLGLSIFALFELVEVFLYFCSHLALSLKSLHPEAE